MCDEKRQQSPPTSSFDFRGLRDWARFWSRTPGGNEYDEGKRDAALDVVEHLRRIGITDENEKSSVEPEGSCYDDIFDNPDYPHNPPDETSGGKS